MYCSSTPVILVVDDSEVVRTSLTNILRECGYEIITCIDGLEGIRKALIHKPNLIIVDILMPNLDGIKMLKVLKILEELNQIPILVLSANTNKTNVLAATEAGADRILNKPFNESDLIKMVNELLGKNLEVSGKNIVVHSFPNFETKNYLRQLFIESFPAQKKNIIEYVNQRNKARLQIIFHELKGIGATVGFPQVTDISRKIENGLANTEVDWDLMTQNCERIFSIITKQDYPLELEK